MTWASRSFSELMHTDHNLLPFLNLLHTHNLISLNPDSQDLPLGAQPKTHLLTYVAQNAFGLKLRYKYGLYKNSPYSPRLYTECGLIQSKRNSTAKLFPNWENLEHFIAFATTHNDVEWLDIAGTLLFARLSYNILDKNIVRYVRSIKPDISPQKVRDVYNTLSCLGHM